MIQYHQAFMYDNLHAHFGWQIGNELDQLHQILWRKHILAMLMTSKVCTFWTGDKC
jgi:hypothetical protein